MRSSLLGPSLTILMFAGCGSADEAAPPGSPQVQAPQHPHPGPPPPGSPPPRGPGSGGQQPPPTEAAFMLAEQAAIQGDTELLQQAIDRARATIDSDPEDPGAWLQLGRIHTLATSGITLHKGVREVQREHQRASIEAMERALALDPGLAEAQRGLGMVLCTLGDYERGLGHLRDAVRLAPDNCGYHIDLATSLTNGGLLDEAERTLRPLADGMQAGCMLVDRMRAQEFLGRAMMERGDHEAAERYLLDAVATLRQVEAREDTYYGCPFQALGALYSSKGMGHEAAASYLELARREHNVPESQIQAALAALATGDLDSARRLEQNARDLGAPPLERWREKSPAQLSEVASIWASEHPRELKGLAPPSSASWRPCPPSTGACSRPPAATSSWGAPSSPGPSPECWWACSICSSRTARAQEPPSMAC